MGNYDDAHDFGEKALAAAHEAKDQVWELNSSVLIAQAEGKKSAAWVSIGYVAV